MTIPVKLFLYIDIIIGIVYLINIIEAVKKGLLYEIVKLAFSILSVYFSYKFAVMLAESLPIFRLDLGIFEGLIDVNTAGNTVIWFIICFTVLRIIVAVILPFLKFLSKIPILGFFNRIGGLLFGLINATIIVLLISLILTLPIIKNGDEVRNGTVIRYVAEVTDEVKNYVIENRIVDIDFDNFKITDITDKIDSVTFDSIEEVREYIDELGIDSVKEIKLNDLTQTQKLKFIELYRKYAEK